MAITMTELARQLNLSQCTVSLVLNNRDAKRVRPEVAEQVRKAARKAGFRLNRAAVELRKRRSETIGIALPSSKNGYHAALIAEIHNEVVQCGYRPVFAFFETDEEQRVATEQLLSGNVEAIITGEPRWIPKNIDLPVVGFYHSSQRFDMVEIDMEKALRISLSYLQELGHYRIGWLGDSFGLRADIFLKLAKEFEVEAVMTSEQYIGTLDFSHGTKLIDLMWEKYKNKFPTALLAHNDIVAFGAIRRLHELGLNVPGDISIIGQDDLAAGNYFIPALTTIAYETPCVVAKYLVEAVMNRLENPDALRRKIIISPQLVVRESCGMTIEKKQLTKEKSK